jgi:hypothetical protein
VSNGSGIGALTFATESGLTTTQTYPFTMDDTNAISVSAAVGGTSAAASASIATDLTDLSRLHSTGSTTASHGTEIGAAEASSTSDFFVFFQLEAPHEYRLAADFVTSGGDTSSPFVADWSQWLVHFLAMNPDMSQGSAVMIESGHDSATLVRSGVLAAGLYRFLVQGTAISANFVDGPASGSALSNFNVSLELNALDQPPAPTPEPASLLLIATGLGGVLAARQRHRVVTGRPFLPRPSALADRRPLGQVQSAAAFGWHAQAGDRVADSSVERLQSHL